MAGFDEQEFKLKRSAQMMTYPSTGVTKTGAPAGHYEISLVDGKVNLPDNTDDNFDKSLTKIGDRRARSCLIWVNDSDCKIQVGAAILPQGMKLVHVIDSMGFDRITLDFPTTRIPKNDFEFLIIASNTARFPWESYRYHISHQTVQTGTAGDAYAVIVQKSVNIYNNILITTENTNANGLTVQIQYSEDGTTWYNDPNYVPGKAITNAGEPDKYASSANHKFIRVQVKNTTAGQNANYKVSLRLVQT